ncbi:DNA-binding PucR family transcriptional regulator [Anoxybacillus tepidamans]|uniref:DNA-binding PucR family transcriptional regulator n=1 Tax=Anoxybacteroides tepidamans TaxID=265948 RepID=A0A7W8IPV2_9BACL|nr:helix-turn-helix domain-containing protein [Anoxybacillus tepidamans]MBB5323529.1 DNA-binding PucR family transcriptional regulator [Anoxybacillus tepidamans]
MDVSNRDWPSNERKFSSLHELVDFVSAVIHCPVTIESRDLELMAYSGNHNEPDAVRMSTILSKRAASHVVHYLHENGWIQQIETADGIVKIPPLPEIGLGPRTVVCLKNGNHIYGYLWVQETSGELAEKQKQFLLKAAQKAAELLEQNMSGSYKRQEDIHRWIMSLIQQGDRNEHDVKIEAELSGVKLPNAFVVALFRVRQAAKKETIRHYIAFIMKSLSGPTFFIENSDQWIVVIGSSSVAHQAAINQAKMFLHKLEHDFHCDLQHDVIVGIGNEYRSLLKMRQSYVEAVEVIKIKRQFCEPIAHFYQDLGIYRWLPSIYEQYKRQGYQNEQLRKLQKYDEENQTVLLETLKQYVKNDCKIKETAECLYVHPNTLHYRLKRIQTIANINLDDFEQRMMLYIDLLFCQYKGDVVLDTQI